GSLWRDQHRSIGAAMVAALSLGALGGKLNAVLIARFKLPPLIVTLGTFSLFRGLAEGLTGGAINYTDFPASFLFFGQGYLWNAVPPQTFVLLAAIIVYWLLLQRTTMGRALYAMGHSLAGARYAGIPVERRLNLIYVLSGLMASVAALIYVAHLGQAKSDAGTGYELMAITTVVLGGTSIFGGRGTIQGTVLGLFAVVILQNGLRLSGMPAELAGILTGVLLLGVIVAERVRSSAFRRGASYAETMPPKGGTTSAVNVDDFDMKNSQVGIICAAIIAAALIIAGSNWMLVNSLRQPAMMTTSAPPAKKLTVGMMPKAKGDPYFISCRKGAEEAARELGVDLLWDGPTGLDPAKQNEVVEAWITRGVDVIAVSVENRAGISTVLRKARERGIKVVTWDADAEKDARDFFINQATPEGIGQTLMDEAARMLGGKGEFAIITGALSAANQNEWIKHIKARLAEKYPEMKLVTIQPSDDDRDKAFTAAQNIMKVHPTVKVIVAISAPAVPGAAEAVKQSGRTDVKVTGLSLPNLCKPYVHADVIESVVLWDTGNLGYLVVAASQAMMAGELKAGASALSAGRLNRLDVKGDNVLLGAPMIFNKANIDKYDF
ncbi:MAG: substrate-binding domain-containing protein, partial [Acidobacteria bacterium]|nr:substrate-binding domain-containing protein [Acidobacteriota bacterium]